MFHHTYRFYDCQIMNAARRRVIILQILQRMILFRLPLKKNFFMRFEKPVPIIEIGRLIGAEII